jgi:hypothetical protein
MKSSKQKLTQKNSSDLLSEKELKLLEEVENNKEVIYLLNTEECEFISRLITSYRGLRRQLAAMQINEQEGWSGDFEKNND